MTDWKKEFEELLERYLNNSPRIVDTHKNKLIDFIAKQKAEVLDELVEKAKEKQSVRADLSADGKRVETPWIPMVLLEDIIEEIKKQ